MGDNYIFHYVKGFIVTCVGLLPLLVNAQITANVLPTENTNCYGSPCSYSGPSILINELMMSPSQHDGSMWGNNANQKGEWIELYNPNICEEIDISCYYLGNNAADGSNYPGGYVIPPGTVVPPAGFALIRGENAPAVPSALLVENGGNVVELVVDGTGVCIGSGNRLWFPNVGGWFAFYDRNGVPQDAVSWANQANLDKYPCVPALAGCGYSGTLANYNEFPNDRKNYILNTSAANFQGQSIRRIPDGGAWSGPSTPTYGYCNSACADVDFINCNGTATANPAGGTPPYSYQWDDPMNQTTQTADKLCAGTYCVTITDALGNTVTECIAVTDFNYADTIRPVLCDGETYTLPDLTVTDQPGTYDFTYQTSYGCDSSLTVIIEVNPAYHFEINPQICAHETYTLPDGTEVNTTGTYINSFQTSRGCDSVYTVNLTVSSPIRLTVDTAICAGTDFTLPDGNVVSNPGQYEANVPGDPTSCDTVFTINLTFHPETQIVFDAFNPVTCHGADDGSIALEPLGTGPYTYEWSDGLDHGDMATGLSPGNYSVTVRNAFACIADTTFTIPEPDPVVLNAFAEDTICFGTSVQLTAIAGGGTGAFTFHWSHTTDPDAVVQTIPDADTVYTVFAEDANLCRTDTIHLPVTVINMFDDSLHVSPSDSVCPGTPVSVWAAYSGQFPEYTYTWSNDFPDGAGPFSFIPENSSVYTVTVSDRCGNTVTGKVPVIVRIPPQVSVDSLRDISCFGAGDGSAAISVLPDDGTYTYIWSDGEDHGAAPSPLGSGTYTVAVADAYGCGDTTSFYIGEPDPIALTAVADSLICPGETVTIQTTASGGSGLLTYLWSHTSDSGANSLVTPFEPTEYHVLATDENGCTSDTQFVFIDVRQIDEALLTVSSDTAFCPGGFASLSGSYSGIFPPYTYQWSGIDEAGPGPFYTSPERDTVYTLTVTDVCGQSVSRDVTVLLFDTPQAILPDSMLSGCSPLQFALTDEYNTGDGYSHQWIFSDGMTYSGNPAEVQLTGPGIYYVQLIVTSPDGCTAVSDQSMPVDVYPVPGAAFAASRWETDITHPEIVFTNTSAGADSWEWILDGTHIFNQNEISHLFSDTGYFAVRLNIQNEYGCRDSVVHGVTIRIDHDIKIPNAFTPGSTGDDSEYDPGSLTNSVFYPFSEYVADFRMSVFNRWGELIFESTDIHKGWNGTYRGEPCPQDVYVYRMDFEFTDGRKETRVGDITLFR